MESIALNYQFKSLNRPTWVSRFAETVLDGFVRTTDWLCRDHYIFFLHSLNALRIEKESVVSTFHRNDAVSYKHIWKVFQILDLHISL